MTISNGLKTKANLCTCHSLITNKMSNNAFFPFPCLAPTTSMDQSQFYSYWSDVSREPQARFSPSKSRQAKVGLTPSFPPASAIRSSSFTPSHVHHLTPVFDHQVSHPCQLWWQLDWTSSEHPSQLLKFLCEAWESSRLIQQQIVGSSTDLNVFHRKPLLHPVQSLENVLVPNCRLVWAYLLDVLHPPVQVGLLPNYIRSLLHVLTHSMTT